MLKLSQLQEGEKNPHLTPTLAKNDIYRVAKLVRINPFNTHHGHWGCSQMFSTIILFHAQAWPYDLL